MPFRFDNLIYFVYHYEQMRYFEWNDEKNEWLMKNRGVSFEMCIIAIEDGNTLAIIQNSHPRAHQKKLVVNIEGYAYVIPFVEDGNMIFLKTMYPSRKETKKYLTQ